MTPRGNEETTTRRLLMLEKQLVNRCDVETSKTDILYTRCKRRATGGERGKCTAGGGGRTQFEGWAGEISVVIEP